MNLNKQTILDWMIELNESLNTDTVSAMEIVQKVSNEMMVLLESENEPNKPDQRR